MYSEEESQESCNYCFSSDSDYSFQCPNCFSKLNNHWKDAPLKKPINSVKEKIKYFSGSSPLSKSFHSFTESEPDTKILNKKNPLEVGQKMYKSRTEILRTANGNLL